MESFDFAVGLGPAGSGLLELRCQVCTRRRMPQSGRGSRTSLSGMTRFRSDSDRLVPGGGCPPEPSGDDGLFVGVDLGANAIRVRSSIAVWTVAVQITSTRRLLAARPGVAVSTRIRQPPRRDPASFIDVDQLTRVVS